MSRLDRLSEGLRASAAAGWSAATFLARLFLYPVHFGVRVLARFLLMISPLLVLAIPVVVVLPLILPQLSPFGRLAGHESLLIWSGILAALASAGVISTLIKHCTDRILGALRSIWKEIRSIAGEDWTPEFEVGQSLTTSWRDGYSEIPGTTWHTLKESRHLLLFSFLVLLLAALTYKPVSTAVDTYNTAFFSDNYYIVNNDDLSNAGVLKAYFTELRVELTKEIRNQSGDVFVFGSEAELPLATTRFTKGTSFALVYPRQGDLDTKVGICPTDWRLEWLQSFKSAMAPCPREDEDGGGNGGFRDLRVNVEGLSSIAPVRQDGQLTKDESDRLNCVIANQRAEAVARFLGSEAGAEAECKEQLKGSRERCGTGITEERQATPGGKVTFTQWSGYKEMRNQRMAEDEPLDDRKKEFEIFNRAVVIELKQDACWRDSVAGRPAWLAGPNRTTDDAVVE